MRRRRGISVGTILMLLLSCVTISLTFAVILDIRKDEGDLAMDAERLLASVGELMTMSQQHSQPAQSTVKVDVVSTSAPEAPAPVVQPTVNDATAPLATQAQQPMVTPAIRRTISMTFGGTIALESSVIAGAFDKEKDAYDYSEILSGIAPAVHADVNFAVLDTMFAPAAAQTQDHIAPIDALYILKDAGFDTAILCGQDALAGGMEAVQQTISSLDAHGMHALGVHMPGTAKDYSIMQLNGLQVAVFTYTETLSSASKKAIADEMQRLSMVHVFDADKACADIKLAKQQGAQFAVVFLHWGTEDAEIPVAAQRKTAQALCDAGADVIIGYNSKYVMPVERLQSGIDPAHQAVVAWSLGTLISEDRSTRGVVSGVLLHVRLGFDHVGQKAAIENVEYTPTYCWRQEENGLYPYREIGRASCRERV